MILSLTLSFSLSLSFSHSPFLSPPSLPPSLPPFLPSSLHSFTHPISHPTPLFTRHAGIPLLQTLSRAPNEKPSGRNSAEFFSDDHESGIFITGRLVLNAWKRMKSEMKLQSYTKHFVAQQLLNRKVKIVPKCLLLFSFPPTLLIRFSSFLLLPFDDLSLSPLHHHHHHHHHHLTS